MAKMRVPESGVKVRMYRQGHGDCFLLAFRDRNGDPFYLLIDCGYKPKSKIHHHFGKVVKHIGDSTDHHLHAVLVTHEHQDHVNGFWTSSEDWFKDIAVDRLWLAWTEDPTDEDANYLRQRYHDTLIGLLAAERQLAAAADIRIRDVGKRVRNLLAFEFEDDDLAVNDNWSRDRRAGLLKLAIKGITNKRAINYIKDKTNEPPLYLEPEHKHPYELPNVPRVRIYALGPPRRVDLLRSVDPTGTEGYAKHFAMTSEARSFLTAACEGLDKAALRALGGNPGEAQRPFPPRYRIPEDQVVNKESRDATSAYLRSHYYDDRKKTWQQIDHDWLRTAETLALRLNTQVNNTCLVIAIELANTGRVLLFSGDAQRGNWISWKNQEWLGPNGAAVSARDLLGRTVFYKVGHHGSHNATLKGYANSDYPNLNWMARGDYRDEFVAMIPANRKWAYEEADWKHPLPSIERALKRKAKGRVFRMDLDGIAASNQVAESFRAEFRNRTKETKLYFEYLIPD